MLDEPAEDGSPLWVLGSWDLEWREVRDTPSDLRITVQRAADYLREHLTWAAQHHDAYDEFVTDLRSCRARLEAVLHAGERDDRAAAPCFDCGGQLVRQVHDHHGRDDRYTCRRCHREYAVAEYWLALRVQLEEEAKGASADSLLRPHTLGNTSDGGPGVRPARADHPGLDATG